MVSLWTSYVSHVPIQKLPIIANYLGVNLTVLVCFWLAEYCDDDEERIVEAVRPYHTTDELSIIEAAREVYAEERLEHDLRSGTLENNGN